MPVALDPTTVTNPPRGTEPDDLIAYADLIATGAFASDGNEYDTKAEAVKEATKIVRGIKWLARTDVRPVARYSTKADGSVVFYIKHLAASEAE